MRATKALKVDEKRLLAYAVAAGAVLAAAGPADASIVYSGLLNKTVTVNDPGVMLSISTVDGDTGAAFSFFNTQHLYNNPRRTPPGNWSYREGYALAFNAALNHANPPLAFVASNFPKNSPVRASGGFSVWLFDKEKIVGGGGTTNRGNFLTAAGGYIGFQITAGAASGYTGWIQINNIAADFSSYTIKDWGYQNDGTLIPAGDTGATTVPEPTSLALIAMGVAGLALYRKRKQDAQV